MPEYKRFVAYFYEYINGKKQKNAGFAKVELRNGMWRILFRLTADISPEPPIHVYGFVREDGRVIGFPFGEMRPGRESTEEWAYGADYTFENANYRFADLAGIWVQSGDERQFITVWDDEGINPEQFALEIVGEEKGQENSQKNNWEEKAKSTEIQMEENRTEKRENSEMQMEKEGRPRIDLDIQISGSEEAVKKQESEKEIEASEAVENRNEYKTEQDHPCMDELFRKRQHVHPFTDDEFTDCIQILPCDIVRLQQENYQVGRSCFLQHGFHQYRHLLMGRNTDGTYVLGVPGMKTQQEAYMAQMFGYDQFRMVRICDCGRAFGYWCRKLKK